MEIKKMKLLESKIETNENLPVKKSVVQIESDRGVSF